MRIAVAEKQRDFYIEEGAILFEDVIETAQQESFFQELEKIRNPEGRDLWRQSEKMRELASHRSLTEVAAQLMQEKMLRIGYDQYLDKLEGKYLDLINGGVPLGKIGSLQGHSCGVLLSLTSEGKGIFIRPDRRIEIEEWVDVNAPYYLILFTSLKAQYVLNRDDPHFSLMTRLGYGNGDRLKEEKNPIVYR